MPSKPQTKRGQKPAAKSAPSPAALAKPGASRARGFPIVGIGASAGGLEALEEFFTHLPKDTGMAFVVVTHQHPGHTSLLPELPGRVAPIKVAPASVVVSERGGVVYIHGRTGLWLEPAAGQPRLNILDMAREGLRLELASALRQAGAQDAEVTREAKASLQSTIEELETANEELKSANEELQSTNAEMQSKVEDLSRTNDDMQNLLNSTDVATVFLDHDLHIKRSTERAKSLIKLIQTDLGRPLADLVSSLACDDLVADCREVLRTLAIKVAEVRTKDGHWYLMRIRPYRTSENVIDGVVATFVDINPVKAAEKSLLRMSKVFLEGPEPMMILDLSGRIVALNDEAVRTDGWAREEMTGLPFQMTVPKSRSKTANDWLRNCLADKIVRNVECAFITKAGRELAGTITLKLLTDDRGQPDAICLLVRFPAT